MSDTVTAADLRAMLRAHPAEALEAVSDMRIAGPWVEQDLIPQWCRLRSPGMVTPDESTGHWMAWARRRLGTYPTLAEALAAVDAHLLAEGWVLVPQREAR